MKTEWEHDESDNRSRGSKASASSVPPEQTAGGPSPFAVTLKADTHAKGIAPFTIAPELQPDLTESVSKRGADVT